MVQTIEVRPALINSPKLRAIARDIRERADFREWAKAQTGPCNEMLARFVLGTLVLVWAAAQDFVTADGTWNHATLEEIDRVAGVPGFGKLMVEVNYLQQNIGSVTFPNWGEWNHVPEAIPEEPAPAPPRSRLRASLPEAGLDGFDEFWRLYPRRVGKAAARQSWGRLKPDASLQKRIMDALAIQVKTDDWQPDRLKFIPHPSTWLNGRRWEDEIEAPAAQGRPWQEILAEQRERARRWRGSPGGGADGSEGVAAAVE